MTDAEKFAAHLDADVIVAETDAAQHFRDMVLTPVSLNAVYRIRERMPIPGVAEIMEKDHGLGPWSERFALEYRGPRALGTWRAQVARLKSRLADLEVVRLIGERAD